METIEKQMVDEKIISFLKDNNIFTLATCVNNIPRCAVCFFVYNEENNLLIFKSKSESAHIQQALANNKISGTVLPEKLSVAKIQGLQFSGIFIQPKKSLESLKKIYYSGFPLALAFSGEIWIIELTEIIMTDSTLGFGKKIQWQK